MIARQPYAGVYLIEIHVEVRHFKTVEKWLEKFKAEWDGDRPKNTSLPERRPNGSNSIRA